MIDNERFLAKGSEVVLKAASHKGKIGFYPWFESRDPLLGELGSSYWNWDSIRFFNPEEEIELVAGELWRATVREVYVSQKQTRDHRIMVFITVGNLRRKYRSEHKVKGTQFVVTVYSGEVKLFEKRVQLQEFRYRIQNRGGTICEFQGLGTDSNNPMAMVGRDVKWYNDMNDLYNQEARALGIRFYAPGLMRKLRRGVIKGDVQPYKLSWRIKEGIFA